MTNASLALQINDVTKIYGHSLSIGNKKILGEKTIGIKNITFSVRTGEIFGFLGPNGAGKTTTIRAMLNFLTIQNGNIKILDLDHKHDAIEIRKRIAYVPGDLSLFDNFTGIELLDYLNHFRPVNDPFLKELKSIFHVNLNKKIKFLSKGNKQQVGLIAALASKPEILILDEPSSGLDPLMTDNLHKILIKLRNEEKITIFLSSHDLTEVHAICDRVGIIKDGKMILIESINELEKKFLQNVEIEFSSNDVPSEDTLRNLKTIMSIKKLNNESFRLTIKGDVNELFRTLINYDIKRFTCENASLDDIFLQFYK